MRFEDLNQSLIVSCQPVPGGPMDNAEMVVGFALAALRSGASALRIESVPYVQAVRQATSAPIVGIVKRDLDDAPVRITPWLSDVEELADAGAEIIAFDATDRPRPVRVSDLIAAIHARGKLAMADCSSVEDARAALEAGADMVGSTLSGYIGGAEPTEPDFALITALRELTPNVIAEGRIRSPDQAAAAVRAGAAAVVVGSAITRTEHATSWFKEAVDIAFGRRAAPQAPVQTVLAVDIGGTKILAALVREGRVIKEARIATDREAGPESWIAALREEVLLWGGEYERVAIAVTGIINEGRWSALNPATLGVPQDYPLVEQFEKAFGVPVFAANDAQAAAWGEHKFGSGQGKDIVFLTISTGIGGGVVINGRPLLGLAGHFGQLRAPSSDPGKPVEDEVSGLWIAAEARRADRAAEAPDVFAAARAGEEWARSILQRSARKMALLCQDIQFALDPERIVIGGGIGLAGSYLDLVRQNLPQLPERLRPELVPAKLGNHAGVIGVADLATRSNE